MKLSRRSFLVSTAITFFIAYVVHDVVNFTLSSLSYYDRYNEGRARAVMGDLRLGQSLLKYDDTNELRRRLTEEREAHRIDFYLLKHAARVVTAEDSWGDAQAVAENRFEPDRVVLSDRMDFGAIAQGEYLLAIGVHKNRAAYLREMFRQEKTSFIIEISVLAALFLSILTFFFRDIREMIQAIRSKDRSKLSKLGKGLTTDAEVIARGIGSYENQIQNLEGEYRRLRKQVTPAMRTELDSGLVPPYQFRCVMVRTDINHYSTIRSTHALEPFLSIINEFFTRSSELIERYGGFVASFVGDEIIYYLKEDEHENAAATALALVRDIHAIAEELHEKRAVTEGYPFRVKSAVACGSLSYGPQVRGFALSGGVFIETVRILSQVDEKEQNSIYLPGRLALRIAPVCRAELKKELELRGVPGVTRLFTVREFAPLSSVLRELSPENSKKLVNFRSDRDLAALFRSLQNIASERGLRGLETCEEVFSSLELLGFPSSSAEVRDEFIRLIERLLSRWEGSPDRSERHMAASGISFAIRIIDRGIYDASVRALLMRCLALRDRRVISNAIDAFIHFEPESRHALLSRLVRHPDNRVMANALIKDGLLDLSADVIQGLRSMLCSSKPLYIASGAFAVGELARHYKARYPTFFETHLDFQELVKELQALVSHPNLMVSRQVARALDKATASQEAIITSRVA